MQLFVRNRIEFLIGGAYALGHYTGLSRETKDFDLMLRPNDVPIALDVCRNAGYEAEFAFSHWLAKIWSAHSFIDVIFRAGNGLAEVDDLWFEKAAIATMMGIRVKIVPPEEFIWQKAYVMERERFDGADVIHLLASCAPRIDWKRLMARFGPDWRVLMSHLVLFGFVFPFERHAVPAEVIEELTASLVKEAGEQPGEQPICNGTLLSRIQYLPDITAGGLIDARTTDRSKIKPAEIEEWTKASLR
jgi:hypothetical protein